MSAKIEIIKKWFEKADHDLRTAITYYVLHRLFFLIPLFILSAIIYAQEPNFKTIHQEQQEHYKALGVSADQYQLINKPATLPAKPQTKACNLNKIVYGWHPYWENGYEANYDWTLISDLCYFAYEVDPATGNASTTHSWATANVVTQALAHNVRAELCVTLFSSHATFFGSSTAKQTLITNLITLVQNRGADGVNIDFEGVPSSQKAAMTAFLVDLCTQMHSQIPGSQISIALYSVDWNSVFDIPVLKNYLDYFIIMGYDYYYSGSTTAGPNDPLFHFGTTYNYTLSKSITYYLNAGVPNSKLVLGLPYYGRTYVTTSSTVPSSVLNPPNSSTVFFRDLAANTNGNWTPANEYWDVNSLSSGWIFQSGGNWKQTWVDNGFSMGKRLDLVNKRDIAGIGIWALGYDDGYSDFWDKITEYLTDCRADACMDTIFDVGGGPNKDYYSNENYTYTIAPPGASKVIATFSSFSTQAAHDTLYIYDGTGTSSALRGSYSGTTGPGVVQTTGGSMTLHFVSDGATVAAGWNATYQCVIDNTPPTTSIAAPNWVTDDFTAVFTDNDNQAVDMKFYQVLDFNGTEWRANGSYGFFNDNFEAQLYPDWISPSGNWVINSAHLNQTNEDSSNTNLYIPLIQTAGTIYLYHWQMNIGGTGTNRRAGLHFFCDDPDALQRGNSYMVYFRVNDSKCQIYRSDNNVSVIKTNDPCTVAANTWHDYKVIFNTTSGEIKAFQDNILVSSWTDPAPYAAGAYLSLRTGNCNVLYDDIKVYTSRGGSEPVSAGTNSDEVRYQNPNPATPACKIKSLVTDAVGNFSTVAGLDVNVDWTPPALVVVFDGTGNDIDTSAVTNEYSAHWDASNDPHSGVVEYWYAIGTFTGATDVVGWTLIGNNTSVTHSGLSLAIGTTYYFSVKSKNGAGLFSSVTASDGLTIPMPVYPPVALFSVNDSTICAGQNVTFISNSSNANTYFWIFENGNPTTSSEMNPTVSYDNAGNFSVTLIASGQQGTDTLIKTGYIHVISSPVASFMVSTDSGAVPLLVLFTNISTNANSYYWDFGNGQISIDQNPYMVYTDTGFYTITLVAMSNNCPSDTLTIDNYIHATDTSLLVTKTPMPISGIKVQPNPYTESATIIYYVNQPAIIKITLTDVVGHTIDTLVNEIQEDVNYIDFNAPVYGCKEGVYFLNFYIDERLQKVIKIVQIR